VLANWQKIKDAFTKDITYNCKGPVCKSSWYAYVYAGGKVEVFLCQQFWNAPDSGTDTKYGTLIHEVSHEVAGTKDHTYGQTNCKNLATNDPDKAAANADNYEYFAEHYELPEGCRNLPGQIIRRLFGSSSSGD
jgi:peptidyl-Lys metalloendopeptidase